MYGEDSQHAVLRLKDVCRARRVD